MKIYLAARYSRNEEMRGHALCIRALGHEVTSRWIKGNHEIGAEFTTDEGRLLATEDVEDLRNADAVILFSEPPRTPNTSRGGRHVEFGLALALAKPIYVVGPKENVFHYLPSVRHFDSCGDALNALEGIFS